MKTIVLAMVAVAGAAASANAQNTNLTWEASVGGGPWASTVAAYPGDVVKVRLKVSFSGTNAVIGFAGTTMMPTLSGIDGDVIGSLDRSVGPDGISTVVDNSGGAVPGNDGRQAPFNTGSPMSSSSPAGLLTYFNDGGGVIRFAGSAATTNATTNNTKGVGLAQKTQSLLGATVFSTDLNPVVFQYSFTVGSGNARVLTATSPAANINLNRGTWYTTAAGTSSVNATIGQQTSATIAIVPTPASLALLGLGGLIAGRRKR